ncbi:MAG: hypothetical protein KGD63_02175 [Candidatus Lokiarchaeota archaeon]|nr:hypothetical protein [Candidatus Lokiarchaeota archaeon]
MIDIDFEIEDVELEEIDESTKLLRLPELTETEVKIIDPIIAPTSGLRIQICDINNAGSKPKYTLSRRKLLLFLRVFKAISIKVKKMHDKKNLKVLLVSDDRPSANILLKYSSQIFAYEEYDVCFQEDEDGKSRVSSPYGAASVALYDDLDIVIVLTASHNDLSWNGIKFYIDYPIPISGDIFKDISVIALGLKEIRIKTDLKPIIIDTIQKNNDYIIDILSKIIEIKSLKNTNLVLWPYLGKAEGLVKLFKQLGANVHLVEDDINPPNPIKEVYEDKLRTIMNEANSNLALLLDADRDRIALYVKENGNYIYYIPNEIYSAMHNILANDFNKKIINVRTIPSDLRGDDTSFLNILTGVGYKHLGIILYFLMDVEVEKSKIDAAILYIKDNNDQLAQIKEPIPLKRKIIEEMIKNNLEEASFVVVMWEESGGHTVNILNVSKNKNSEEYLFQTDFPLVADKYPVTALVLITELICRGYEISKSIDWSIKGINQTISAKDEEKVKIMQNFKINDGKSVEINNKSYKITALKDNSDKVDIYEIKSDNSIIYFRPSGTGPDVRFYIFGHRDTHLAEIEEVKNYVKDNFA